MLENLGMYLYSTINFSEKYFESKHGDLQVSQFQQIIWVIFTHLKLCVVTAAHNFK